MLVAHRVRILPDCVAPRFACSNFAQDDNQPGCNQQLGRPLYARDKYAPSDVSTLIFSPSLINGGTCTTSPVSVLAGLVTLEAVALFRPGSVSMTVRITVCGSSMPTAFPSKNSTLISRFAIR